MPTQTFRQNLKRELGHPMIDVELDEKADIEDNTIQDDYDWVEDKVLRKIRTFFPCEYILTKVSPANDFGKGNIDLSDEDILTVKEVYVVKPRTSQGDVLLPWSLVRIWEKIWVGASEFVGTDLLLYKNELDLLAKASDNAFWWKWYELERKIYLTGIPSWASSIGIMCLKGINSIDHIAGKSFEYGLALKLGVAYAKQKMGLILGKHKVEGMELPGGDYKKEGEDMEKDVLAEIEINAYYPGGL